MSLERLCRVGNDFTNLKEVVLTAVRLCRKTEDWSQLNTTLTLLSKRRGQHGKTVTAMVQEVSTVFFCCFVTEVAMFVVGGGGVLMLLLLPFFMVVLVVVALQQSVLPFTSLRGALNSRASARRRDISAVAAGARCMRTGSTDNNRRGMAIDIFFLFHLAGMFIAVLPQAMTWLDEAPTKEARIALLVALRDITDGKIFVEAERAKLTRLLAKVRQIDN